MVRLTGARLIHQALRLGDLLQFVFRKQGSKQKETLLHVSVNIFGHDRTAFSVTLKPGSQLRSEIH